MRNPSRGPAPRIDPRLRCNSAASPGTAPALLLGSAANASAACFNVHRLAARLPLSTVETNSGASGCSVVTSYQFRQWPRCLGKRRYVLQRLPRLDDEFGQPITPKCTAAMRAFSSIPRLVGDSRSSPTAFRTDVGNQPVGGRRNSSRERSRQIRFRRFAQAIALFGAFPAGGWPARGRRFSQLENARDTIHSKSTGAAASSACGRRSQSVSARPSAIHGVHSR